MVAGSALLVCCLATLASSFAPIVAPRAATTAVGAAPRWVDGPGDIEEAARVSKFTSNAVSVLYFSALASTHASALSTFELLAAALPRCEFLLAEKNKDKECWGAFARCGDVELPCVEVFHDGASAGVVGVGEMAGLLSDLGYSPGGGGGGGGPASPSDGAKFFNIADDLWERSADSRNDPNFRGKVPPPSNRKQERQNAQRNQPPKAPRTTASYFPGAGMGQAPPPGMGDTIKKQQDAERAGMDGLPPGARAAKKEIEGLKKKFDQMARDMGKDTAEVQKKLSQLVRGEQARAAARPRPASGGETKRAKLDRLFAMDADSSDAPADENLSDFAPSRTGARAARTRTRAKQGAEDEPGAGDDYYRLGKIGTRRLETRRSAPSGEPVMPATPAS
ncbi:hypothetical protein JL722_12836 [Aureococcus anophagefferens]|nr:hypothetical protein JL722_12836 [Aureococcus anophagefferens]